VVAGFGSISSDNRRIIAMEWIAEGLAHIGVAVIVIVTAVTTDAGEGAFQAVCWSAAALLVAIAVVTVFTGARTPVVWFKVCPVVLGTVAALLVSAGVVSRQAGDASAGGAWWTVREAESIAVVRGMPVHVQACRGVGPGRIQDGARVHRQFECTAGTGRPADRADTVGVTYRLRPLGPWEVCCPPHALTDTRFFGGPGIP
jgi:uncharacterized membrane protein